MQSKLILTPEQYQAKLDKYYNVPSKASGNLTLKQFFELMYYTLDIEKPGLVFAPAWPAYLLPTTEEWRKTMDNPVEMFMDTVTYMVTRQEPGAVGGTKQPFGSPKELTPRIRQTVNDQEGQSRLIYGQWFDTLVQFDLWTLTNFEAETLVLWFQRFMTIHRNFLKHMGLSEFHFWWRGRDAVSSAIRNNLHVRTVVFYIRTEELSYEDDYNLKELEIKINELEK